MKIKPGFLLRNVADVNVVVPVGEMSVDFNGIITLNDTGKFLFERLMVEDTSEDGLLLLMLEEYEVDEETAKADIREFVSKIEEANLFA
jgi:hypothetical protein